MRVLLKDKNGQEKIAQLLEATLADVMSLDDWQFDWSTLITSPNCTVFQLKTERVEALMKIEFVEPDFFEMKNIEVSPANFGAEGKYTNVAQILIAYGCLISFELNKGPYKGYLSFISKGELIDYYIQKYGAELAFRDRMFISPSKGLEHIKEHLNIYYEK